MSAMAGMQYPKALMPRPKSKVKKSNTVHVVALSSAIVIFVAFFSFPTLLTLDLELQAEAEAKPNFTVTVNPDSKTIVEDPAIEALLEEEPTSLSASTGSFLWVFEWVAKEIASLPLYTLVAGSNQKFVTIQPGYREEEVVRAFGSALGWGTKARQAFAKQLRTNPPVLEEGQFQPGTYAVSSLMTTEEVQIAIYDRFAKEILDRYSTTTAEKVPLRDALIIASLIEREAGGWHDMRDISGILWNRLFTGMPLQIDATLQYAKATGKDGNWWPKPLPADKNIKSKYNTYRYEGLPPGPIASPSVAAIVAALNPKKTDCMFYFHDDNGVFHCSVDYAGHVKLLKKYYGRGK